MWTRRAFLKGSSLAVLALGWGGLPAFLARAASAQTRPKKTLVALFQRGAMDGLMAVQPLGDSQLATLRPQLFSRTAARAGCWSLTVDTACTPRSAL